MIIIFLILLSNNISFLLPETTDSTHLLLYLIVNKR
jgi:hypothetical protein